MTLSVSACLSVSLLFSSLPSIHHSPSYLLFSFFEMVGWAEEVSHYIAQANCVFQTGFTPSVILPRLLGFLY